MGIDSRRPFYDEYAWAYDALIAPPSSQQCDFIVEMLSRRSVLPGARILDAGCGTGRHAVELARRGYIVTGVDISARLIAEAHQRLSGPSLSVSFAVGDILALPITREMDGILCRGVLNDLLDEACRREVFRSFARVLRPGGAVILDVREWEASARRKRVDPAFEKSVETIYGRLTFRSITQLEPQTRRLLVAERHTLGKNSEEVVSDYDFKMQCWTEEELKEHLTEAGFADILYFGAYDQTKSPGASDRLIAVASRRSASD